MQKKRKKSPACHTRTASHRPQALMQPPCRTSQVICLRNAELADLHRRPAVQSLRCGLCACCFFMQSKAEQSKAKQRRSRSRNYSAIKHRLVVFSVCPLLREPLHRPMCCSKHHEDAVSTNRLWY